MKTVKLLLASFDKRTNNLVEAVVRNVCFGRAMVDCCNTTRIDKLYFMALRDDFDLIVIAPDHLMPEPSRKTDLVPLEESWQMIRRLKAECRIPILAVSVPKAARNAALEAGAVAELGLFFKSEALEEEVRSNLYLPEAVEAAPEEKVPVTNSFWRGLQRFIPHTQ